MAPKSHTRRQAIIVPAPVASAGAPATLIFVHRYNCFASQFTCDPPKHINVAHHIHKSPSLQHVKIIIPEGLPSIHPSIHKNVWYDIPSPIPQRGDPRNAERFVEFGHSENNADDMEQSLDYLESLVRAEIATGTPANRIVFMGDSQGAGLVVLLLLTRRLAADLAAVIAYAGFPPIDLQSVRRMQRQHGLSEKWSKETALYLLHGTNDELVPIEISRAWLAQLEGLRNCGQGIGRIEWKAIDGMQHALVDLIWPYVRDIVERSVPAPELEPSSKL